MMAAPIYFSIAVAALCGLWFLWDVGLKGLFLDMFREKIFALRFELFEMGTEGSVPFSSDAYRLMETLLNGLLRYGHRFTFMTYVFSVVQQWKTEGKDTNLNLEIRKSLSGLDLAAQERLNGILRRMTTTVTLYASCTSLLFLLSFALFLILRLFRVVSFSSPRDVGQVLEREAFREMQQEPWFVAA